MDSILFLLTLQKHSGGDISLLHFFYRKSTQGSNHTNIKND